MAAMISEQQPMFDSANNTVKSNDISDSTLFMPHCQQTVDSYLLSTHRRLLLVVCLSVLPVFICFNLIVVRSMIEQRKYLLTSSRTLLVLNLAVIGSLLGSIVTALFVALIWKDGDDRWNGAGTGQASYRVGIILLTAANNYTFASFPLERLLFADRKLRELQERFVATCVTMRDFAYKKYAAFLVTSSWTLSVAIALQTLLSVFHGRLSEHSRHSDDYEKTSNDTTVMSSWITAQITIDNSTQAPKINILYQATVILPAICHVIFGCLLPIVIAAVTYALFVRRCDVIRRVLLTTNRRHSSIIQLARRVSRSSRASADSSVHPHGHRSVSAINVVVLRDIDKLIRSRPPDEIDAEKITTRRLLGVGLASMMSSLLHALATLIHSFNRSSDATGGKKALPDCCDLISNPLDSSGTTMLQCAVFDVEIVTSFLYLLTSLISHPIVTITLSERLRSNVFSTLFQLIGCGAKLRLHAGRQIRPLPDIDGGCSMIMSTAQMKSIPSTASTLVSEISTVEALYYAQHPPALETIEERGGSIRGVDGHRKTMPLFSVQNTLSPDTAAHVFRREREDRKRGRTSSTQPLQASLTIQEEAAHKLHIVQQRRTTNRVTPTNDTATTTTTTITTITSTTIASITIATTTTLTTATTTTTATAARPTTVAGELTTTAGSTTRMTAITSTAGTKGASVNMPQSCDLLNQTEEKKNRLWRQSAVEVINASSLYDVMDNTEVINDYYVLPRHSSSNTTTSTSRVVITASRDPEARSLSSADVEYSSQAKYLGEAPNLSSENLQQVLSVGNNDQVLKLLEDDVGITLIAQGRRAQTTSETTTTTVDISSSQGRPITPTITLISPTADDNQPRRFLFPKTSTHNSICVEKPVPTASVRGRMQHGDQFMTSPGLPGHESFRCSSRLSLSSSYHSSTPQSRSPSPRLGLFSSVSDDSISGECVSSDSSVSAYSRHGRPDSSHHQHPLKSSFSTLSSVRVSADHLESPSRASAAPLSPTAVDKLQRFFGETIETEVTAINFPD